MALLPRTLGTHSAVRSSHRRDNRSEDNISLTRNSNRTSRMYTLISLSRVPKHILRATRRRRPILLQSLQREILDTCLSHGSITHTGPCVSRSSRSTGTIVEIQLRDLDHQCEYLTGSTGPRQRSDAPSRVQAEPDGPGVHNLYVSR